MWKTVKLGDVADVKAGNSAPQDKSLYEAGQYPFVRTSDVGSIKIGRLSSTRDLLNEIGIQKLKLFPRGTILFPKSGASTFLNHRVILNIDAYVASHLATIKASDGHLLDNYAWYFLQTIDASDLVADSAYPSLQAKTIKEIPIPLPPLAEQQRIVAKLDAAFAEIDRAIEVAEAKEAEVERLKASLLSSSLGGNVLMWETVKLGDLFKIGSSKRVLKAEWKDSGVPFYRGREITTLSKTGNVDNDLFISEEHFSQLKSKYGVPQEGDLVVTAIGTIGNTYIVREQDRFYFKDASVLWLQKVSGVNSRFVDYWFKSSSFFEQLEVGNGATVDTLSISKLNVMDFPLPPLAEQQRIVAKLDAAFAEVNSAKQAIQRAKENHAALKAAILAQELTPPTESEAA